VLAEAAQIDPDLTQSILRAAETNEKLDKKLPARF